MNDRTYRSYTYIAEGQAMSICWWGFSSTSRSRDVIPNDVKGETIHPERRLAPCFNTRPRCILMLGVSSPSSSLTLIYLPFPSTTLRDLRRSIALENYSTKGASGGFATESRDTDCTILENRMSDNATHSDVTVDNLEISLRTARPRRWTGKVRDRRL